MAFNLQFNMHRKYVFVCQTILKVQFVLDQICCMYVVLAYFLTFLTVCVAFLPSLVLIQNPIEPRPCADLGPDPKHGW
jgi:hypothetical protein